MRVTTSLALAALTATAVSSGFLAQSASAAPLAAPMGVTYSTVEPTLPPGVSPEQAAMAPNTVAPAPMRHLVVSFIVRVSRTTCFIMDCRPDPSRAQSCIFGVGVNSGRRRCFARATPQVQSAPFFVAR